MADLAIPLFAFAAFLVPMTLALTALIWDVPEN